jgi:anti-sigma-K factor RskA
MSDMTAQLPEDDLLAAELALGVLAGAQRMAADMRSHSAGDGVTSAISAAQGASRSSQAATIRAKP